LVEGEEEAVPSRVGAASGAAQALQEGGDRGGSVDLDDPVQVTDVDAQFQGARGDDDAVAGLGERGFRASALVEGEGGVREERGHVLCPQLGAQFLDQAP
jgi:hypothetical protein